MRKYTFANTDHDLRISRAFHPWPQWRIASDSSVRSTGPSSAVATYTGAITACARASLITGEIQNANSEGFCLTSWNTSKLQQVQVGLCRGLIETTQTWTYDPTTGAIKDGNGLCLAVVANSAGESGDKVVSSTCHGGPNQEWQWEASGAIKSASGLCLDLNKRSATLWSCYGGPNQKWLSSAAVTPTPPAVSIPLPIIIGTSLLALGTLQQRQGPILIEGLEDETIQGFQITNPDGPCIVVRNSKNIRITRNSITRCRVNGAAGDAGIIISDSADVRVDYNYLSDIGPNLLAIFSFDSSRVFVDHNQFERTSGGFTAFGGSAISATHNRFKNMLPRGGAVSGLIQFANGVSGAGNTIACNLRQNEGSVVPQAGDMINVFKSGGTPESPLNVYGNRLIGTGANLSGDGLASAAIQIGDGSFSSNIRVYFSQVLNVGGSGIWVSGGDNIEVTQNRVYQAGRVSEYSAGMGAVNFYGASAVWQTPGAYYRNVSIRDNAVMMSKDNISRALMTDFTMLNDWPNCENLTATNNDLVATLDESIVATPARAVRSRVPEHSMYRAAEHQPEAVPDTDRRPRHHRGRLSPTASPSSASPPGSNSNRRHRHPKHRQRQDRKQKRKAGETLRTVPTRLLQVALAASVAALSAARGPGPMCQAAATSAPAR